MSTQHDADGGRIEKAHDGNGGVTGETALFLVKTPPETPVRDLGVLYEVWKRDRDEFERRVRNQVPLEGGSGEGGNA